MASLCATFEYYRLENIDYRRQLRQGWTPALEVFEVEHAWRCEGEPAIRREMEHRLAVYFAKPRRKGAQAIGTAIDPGRGAGIERV